MKKHPEQPDHDWHLEKAESWSSEMHKRFVPDPGVVPIGKTLAMAGRIQKKAEGHGLTRSLFDRYGKRQPGRAGMPGDMPFLNPGYGGTDPVPVTQGTYRNTPVVQNNTSAPVASNTPVVTGTVKTQAAENQSSVQQPAHAFKPAALTVKPVAGKTKSGSPENAGQPVGEKGTAQVLPRSVSFVQTLTQGKRSLVQRMVDRSDGTMGLIKPLVKTSITSHSPSQVVQAKPVAERPYIEPLVMHTPVDRAELVRPRADLPKGKGVRMKTPDVTGQSPVLQTMNDKLMPVSMHAETAPQAIQKKAGMEPLSVKPVRLSSEVPATPDLPVLKSHAKLSGSSENPKEPVQHSVPPKIQFGSTPVTRDSAFSMPSDFRTSPVKRPGIQPGQSKAPLVTVQRKQIESSASRAAQPTRESRISTDMVTVRPKAVSPDQGGQRGATAHPVVQAKETMHRVGPSPLAGPSGTPDQGHPIQMRTDMPDHPTPLARPSGNSHPDQPIQMKMEIPDHPSAVPSVRESLGHPADGATRSVETPLVQAYHHTGQHRDAAFGQTKAPLGQPMVQRKEAEPTSQGSAGTHNRGAQAIMASLPPVVQRKTADHTAQPVRVREITPSHDMPFEPLDVVQAKPAGRVESAGHKTTVQRQPEGGGSSQQASSMADTAPSSSPSVEQPQPPSPGEAPTPNLTEIADQVYDMIMERLTIERESMGL